MSPSYGGFLSPPLSSFLGGAGGQAGEPDGVVDVLREGRARAERTMRVD
jgi:hypothetical protein